MTTMTTNTRICIVCCGCFDSCRRHGLTLLMPQRTDSRNSNSPREIILGQTLGQLSVFDRQVYTFYERWRRIRYTPERRRDGKTGHSGLLLNRSALDRLVSQSLATERYIMLDARRILVFVCFPDSGLRCIARSALVSRDTVRRRNFKGM